MTFTANGKSFKTFDFKLLPFVSCFCCFIDLELNESEKGDKIEDNFCRLRFPCVKRVKFSIKLWAL